MYFVFVFEIHFDVFVFCFLNRKYKIHFDIGYMSKWTVRRIIREAIAFKSKQYRLNVLNISCDSV